MFEVEKNAMAEKYVFVITCRECGALTKVADDTGSGIDHYLASDQDEDRECPHCGHVDRYQAAQVRRVRASSLNG